MDATAVSEPRRLAVPTRGAADELLVAALADERAGRHDLAHPKINTVVRSRPEDPVAWLCLARVELGLGNPAAASAAVERADALLVGSADRSEEIPLLRGVCALLQGDRSRGERLLREELAAGQRPAAAAMYLADFLGRRERLEEALAVLDAALRRVKEDLALELARGRVMMDLGRFDEAAAEFDRMSQRWSDPRVLYQTAVAYRALGDRDRSQAALQQLMNDFSDHPWVTTQGPQLAQMAQAMVADGRGSYTTRELLAIVRSSTDVVLRVRALQTLAGVGGEDLRRGLRVAMADPEYVVRLNALRIGWEVTADREDWVKRGLGDQAPAVRAAGAELAAELPRARAIPTLLVVLDSEEDGYVFEKMHNVLIKLDGERSGAPSARGLNAEGRARVRAFWRERWGR